MDRALLARPALRGSVVVVCLAVLAVMHSVRVRWWSRDAVVRRAGGARARWCTSCI